VSNLVFTLPALEPEKCHAGAGGEGIVDLGESF